jgi:hypothetical protein
MTDRKPNPLYEPTTRRAKVLWTLFSVASIGFCAFEYVRYLIEN